jgi:polysaccharide deacetylase family protein (PEP-CTERM system associated)
MESRAAAESAQICADDTRRPFFFSIDLEDIRLLVPGGERYRERVPENTHRYLDLLARHDLRCTFFTTGDVARRYPELVSQIAAAGHEIACHSSDHLPLDRHSRASFREDLLRCRDDFGRAGVTDCKGFRAPIASLFEETRWAYEVLQELGFVYSASVLAAEHPLYGWPSFGSDQPRRIEGIWEIPISLSRIPGLDVPFAGGVYFRVLPFVLVRRLFERRSAAGRPVFGYLHPYDIDSEQERFMHPEIGDSAFYNWLLYWNRSGTLRRCDALFRDGWQVRRYDEYVERLLRASINP